MLKLKIEIQTLKCVKANKKVAMILFFIYILRSVVWTLLFFLWDSISIIHMDNQANRILKPC